MTTFYIDPVAGNPYNNGTSAATPVATLSLTTATVTGYIGTSSDGGNTISAPSNVLTITSITSGVVMAGKQLAGTGVTAGTYTTSDGSTLGLAGTYTVNQAQSVPLTTFTISNPNIFGGTHTYLLKRGTVLNTTNVSGGLSTGSNWTIDAYGSGAKPIISSSSGPACSMANRFNTSVSNVDFISLTGTKCLDGFNHGSAVWNDCSFTGYSAGFYHSISANAQDLIFNRCSFKNTNVSNVQSAFFGQAGTNGAIFKNIQFNSCTIDGSLGAGIQLKCGDNGATNSYYDGVLIDKCTLTNNYGAVLITVGDVNAGGVFGRYAHNVTVTRNEVAGNLGVGMAITAYGGYVAFNNVHDNCFGTLTGTGGLQMGGAYGVLIELNTVYHNGSGNYGADGAGIYLDQVVGNSFYGTNSCTIRKNIIWDHKDFHSNSNTSGNISSPGIKLYHSDHNEVYGNICFNNHVGICVDNACPSNKIYNNTLINNDEVGIALGWNVGGTNNILNNLIIGSPVDISAPSVIADATTGSITLSSAGTAADSGYCGIATVTSTANDFINHHQSYFIREKSGTGYGYIYKPKTSNSVVSISILSPFSGTSFANGAWELCNGTGQTGNNNYNMAFNSSRANGGVGAAQVLVNLTAGANDLSAVDPLLDSRYNVNAPSLKAGGKWLGLLLDYYSKEFRSPPSIGAVQDQGTRTNAQRLTGSARNVITLV